MPLPRPEENTQEQDFSSPWELVCPWIDRLQWLPAGLACAFYLQGKGSGPALLLLSFSVPALRCLVSEAFRGRVLRWLSTLRNSLRSYPFQSDQPPWLAAFVWVVLPIGSLLLLRDYAIVSGDSRPAVLTASSLVSQGHCELSRYVDIYSQLGLFTSDGQRPYFCRRTSSGIYSSYPLGMVPFVLPVAAAAYLCGADLDQPKVHDRLEKWTAAWLTALCLGLVFLLALQLAPPNPAWMTTVILATGSAMFTTVGQALWQHGGVILWSLLALLIEFRHHDRPRPMATFLQGFAFAMMVACRLSSVVLVVPFFIWVFLRSPVRALVLGIFSGLAFAPWAFLHMSIYGTILGPSTAQLAAGNWSGGGLSSLMGVLISPGRGVLIYQPWIVIIVLTLLPCGKRSLDRCARCPLGWESFCLCASMLQLVLISSWNCWWGGYCWGSRLAAEVIPLLALLCVRPVALLWRTRNGKAVVFSLALVSCLMHVPAIYMRSADWNGQIDVDHHSEKLWSWSHPPFLHPLLH